MSAANDKAIDPALFRETLGHYLTGVTVVTATYNGDPVGMVVGTFSSISLTPADWVHADARLEKLCATADRTFCVNAMTFDFDHIPWCYDAPAPSHRRQLGRFAHGVHPII